MTDLEILARIVQCEAGGEGEQGMKAVACVVMNRVHVDYGGVRQAGDDQRGDHQTGQFDCAWETIRGKYNAQNIYNMSVEDIHYDIAEWAIAGNRLTNLGFALWYFNPFSPSCRPNFPSNVGSSWYIGNYCFYNPTDAYADT